jgi:2-oxoglutarate ferredoxin oxidoreductase subunit gamma
MSDLTQILLCGLGGQGVVLAGTILGQAAVNDGKWVAGSNAYGSQARGGVARSEVVISSSQIPFPGIIQPDILLAFSQSTYDTDVEKIDPKKGLVLYDRQLIKIAQLPETRHLPVPAADISNQIVGHDQSANMVMLGALVGATGIASEDSLLKAVEQYSSLNFQKQNIEAAQAGVKLGADSIKSDER